MSLNVLFCLATTLMLMAPGVLCALDDAGRDSRGLFYEDESEESCYGKLGCLTTTGGWFFSYHRWMNFMPQSREKIGTKFTLYTRKNMEGEVIRVNDDDQVDTIFYSGNRKTRFIIHGFLGNAKADWVKKIMEALLKREDANVITVDWSSGAKPPYNQAAVNTRVVGLEIAYLVNKLVETRGAFPDDFHLIGHSLGAHTAGYAGERIKGLGRITGLDPAGPWFTDMPPFVRLDTTDADFVDIIHTDAELVGFGIEKAIGHVDFYPNGGYRQPGCGINASLSSVMGALNEGPSCSHSRSELLFLESISSSPFLDGQSSNKSNPSCSFTAFHCNSYESFLDGSCVTCRETEEECAVMGFDADKYPGRGVSTATERKFFLKTNSGYPFCGYHYAVKAKLPTDYKGRLPAVGDLVINVHGDKDVAKEIVLTEAGARKMLNGTAYNFIGFSPINVGNITKVEVTWTSDSILPCITCDKGLSLTRLEVTKLGNIADEEPRKSCKTEPFTIKNKVTTSIDMRC